MRPPDWDPFHHTPDQMGQTHCGAPSGIALSEDEGRAFVFCRSSRDLAIVDLAAHDGHAQTLQSARA